jgi:hypothetical protein
MKPGKWFISAITILALAAFFGTAAMAEVSEGHKIKSVKQVGRVIELQDGSEWSIENPDDQEIAYQWLPFQDISILKGNVLRNDHTGERIDAKMLQEATKPKAADAKPSSTPVYSEKVVGKPYMVKPGEAPPPADQKILKEILRRLDTLDAKIQVMDWRLRKIEKESMRKP